MNQLLNNNDSCINEEITNREIPINSLGKSNTWDQLENAPSQAGVPKKNCGTQRKEKTNNSKQCDFASHYKAHLRTHIELHTRE